MKRFTLLPGNWYSCEFIGDEFVNGFDAFMLIRVHEIVPLGNGNRSFVLKFFHLNHSEGVQEKEYTLETIERSQLFLLAKSVDHKPNRYLKLWSNELNRSQLEDDWRIQRRRMASLFDELINIIQDYPSRYKGAYLSLENLGIDHNPFMNKVNDVLKITEYLTGNIQKLNEANIFQNHGSEESFEVYEKLYANLREAIFSLFSMFTHLSDPLIELARTEQGESLLNSTQHFRKGLEDVFGCIGATERKMKCLQLLDC